MNYLVDVLLGKDDERIQRFGHHELSTFGIGQDLSANDWRAVFRQLVARGYLVADHDNFGGLRMTEACRPLLRGEETLKLAKQVAPAKRGKKARTALAESGDPGEAAEGVRHFALDHPNSGRTRRSSGPSVDRTR